MIRDNRPCSLLLGHSDCNRTIDEGFQAGSVTEVQRPTDSFHVQLARCEAKLTSERLSQMLVVAAGWGKGSKDD